MISLCTTPEATCERMGDTRRPSRFRPPSMSFQTRRHPDGHRCLGAYDIQEAVGAWLTFVQREQTSEDNCTPPLLLKRHYREDRLHRGGQKTRATSCSRKIVTDIRKLFWKKSQALEQAPKMLWNLPSSENSESESTRSWAIWSNFEAALPWARGLD